MIEHLETKAAFSIEEDGTITGLAAVFGTPDLHGDIIERGAFASASIDIPMLFGHDQNQPIGRWETIRETDAGLEVKGRLLTKEVGRAGEVHALIRARAVSGLSIGFTVARKALRGANRVLQALNLHEISVVTVPCHPGARILTVKSASQGNEMEEQTTAPDISAIETGLAALQTEVKSFGKITERLDRFEARFNRPATAPSAEEETAIETKAFAAFLRGSELERKALTVAADAPGYILAPEERSGEFLRNLVEFSPVRAVADVRTTGSHTVMLPKRLTVTNAKWKGEATPSEASEPTFDQMEISIKEMTTHVDIGNWMIEDATHDVEAEVRLALAEDFAAKEGLAFVNGSAALEPKGFMADADIGFDLNGHVANLSADALITMIHKLPAVYRNRGTFAMNGSTLAAIRKLKDGAGNYLWQPAYQAGQPETILGRPVVELVNMPDPAANAFPIIFGDFKAGYRIYDRVELAIRPNPYLLATEGLVRFHARRRVGAAVVRPEAFRKLKMATA